MLSSFYDFGGQFGSGSGFDPIQGFQVIANELLVEAGGRNAFAPFGGLPITGRIRSEDFVDQVNVAILIEAEFELSIR